MSSTPSQFIPTPQQWPCGPDCIFAKASPGTYGEWMWCERPGADERLVRTGHECVCFRAPLYPGERFQPPPPSAGS